MTRKISPLILNYRVGLLFVEKREPAELGRRFASQNVDPASGILGSFIMKKFLNITVFLPHKRPKIFTVLT